MAEILNSIMPFAGSFVPKGYEYYGEEGLAVQSGFGGDIRYIIKKHSTSEENTPLMGQIMLFIAGYVPRGWHVCDGSLLNINDNSLLFATLIANYGGDGMNTFGLPKIPSIKTGSGELNYIICMEGAFPSRARH